MSYQVITSQIDARQRILNGLTQVAELTISTLGAAGKNVVFIDEYGTIRSTKDGVTVIKSVNALEDPVATAAIMMLKQASIQTAEQAGDGTTTSVALAYSMISEAFSRADELNTFNTLSIRNGMNKAAEACLDIIRNRSWKVRDNDDMFKVATLSANGDEVLAHLIIAAFDNVGSDGLVIIEENQTGRTFVDHVKGIRINRGLLSGYFATDPDKNITQYDNPLVLCVNHKIGSKEDKDALLSIMEYVAINQKALVIIAEDFDTVPLQTMLVNFHSGNIRIVPIKAPDYGERKTRSLEDLAIITGGKLVGREFNRRLEDVVDNLDWMGTCQKVTVTKDHTTFIEGAGDDELIRERTEQIRNLIAQAESAYEREILQNRMARLAGGVSVISLGSYSDVELRERKDRAEDALFAVYSAIESGIVVGGGATLFRVAQTFDPKSVSSDVAEQFGAELVVKALQKPIQYILENAGYSDDRIDHITNRLRHPMTTFPTDRLVETNVVYDVRSNTFMDGFESGIFDPVKVIKCALENAISVASVIISTYGVVYTEKEDTDKTSAENFNA